MVTQDAAVVPKVNKVKMKKMKKKKSKKKKIKGTENLDSESEADKLDLDEKVYPLSRYISDQDELVNQMFMTIRGSKLEAMLPPMLKSIPVKELKRLCLHELRGMSKKRILCCINGQVMEGSSGSEDEEEEKEGVSEANSKGEKRTGDEQPPDSYLQKKIKVEPGLEDGTGSGEGKSVLELLELEMRARIIKTMLEKGDEGKKITEDAIAAVMESAKKITSEGVDATGSNKEVAISVTNSKDDLLEKKSGGEAVGEDDDIEERSRGRRRGQGRRSDRRGHHELAHDGKRGSGSRSQKRDGSYSGDDSSGRSSKKQKESDISKKHMMKKKKITRKEFEERMKRAKKNRTYRQRKSSEDEEKTKENENKSKNTKDGKDEKTEDKTDKKKDAPPEGNSINDKTEGEASEKEEGEIDSNEEEEGACSPSEISSASRYSSSRSSSRSWSRSYSRSLSRSPYRGRQRRSRRRSRSRRRRRSYSRSYSRSRTPDRRRSRGDYQPRNYERKRSRDSPKGNSKRDVKKTSPEDISPSREEDWGHKCDIEFVDSEEDFDDNPDATKKDSGAQKTLPVNRIERASISFSLQKKPVGFAQSVDLDDLPLKKKQMSGITDDVETLDTVKPTTKSEEIVISSDSEVELQASSQKSLIKPEAGCEKESEVQHLVTSANNSKLGGAKKANHSSSKGNTRLQPDQEKTLVKKTDDSETKGEETNRGTVVDNSGGSLKLTPSLDQETCTEQKSSDEIKSTQNVGNKNTEIARGIRAMENINKDDNVVNLNKGDSSSKGSKTSENMDDSECANLDCDAALEKLNRDMMEHDVSHEYKQMEKEAEKLIIDSVEGVNTESASKYKEKAMDCLDKDNTQDIDAAEALTSRVIDVRVLDDDDFSQRERNVTKSDLEMDTEQSSDKETKQNMEREVKVKDGSSIHPLEEEDQRDSNSNQTRESKQCKAKGVKTKFENAAVCSETEEKLEKSEILPTKEQKDEESDSKDACSTSEGQTEEDFYRGANHLEFNEDEKINEDTNDKGFCKDKTPVEPFKIETGFTRKPSQKIEISMPERSWLKRDRKKREKAKDFLGMEKAGSSKSAQCEDDQSPSQKCELETETSQSIKTPETAEIEEMPVHSPALVSDTENSQPVEETERQKQAYHSPKKDISEFSHAEDKTSRKIDNDTEIIGVIETSKDTSDSFDDMELGGSSWSMRWLQSEKVQKVVTSSKMLSRVRKKIQRKEKATKVVNAEKVEEAQKPTEPVISVIGSIEEYERLFGTKVKKDEAPIAAGGSEFQDNMGVGQVSGSTAQTQHDIPELKAKGNPVFGSDDDGEDSEEEALWSKIIKK